MKLKLPGIFGTLFKTTQFWRENHLILQEFRYFRELVFLAIFFAFTAAAFEGMTVGFIASFLQGLTNPNEPPIQTGVSWFDTFFLATQAPAAERIYRLSGLLLIGVWLRAGFDYLGEVYSKKSSL